MGLPGHHRTSSDKRKRSAHFGLKPTFPTVCSKCKKPVMPHRACAFCGTYMGREVVAMQEINKAIKQESKVPKEKKPAAKKVAAAKS